jgi:hypothetical protein
MTPTPLVLSKQGQWALTAAVVFLAGAPCTPVNQFKESLLMPLYQTNLLQAITISVAYIIFSVALVWFVLHKVLDNTTRFRHCKTAAKTEAPVADVSSFSFQDLKIEKEQDSEKQAKLLRMLAASETPPVPLLPKGALVDTQTPPVSAVQESTKVPPPLAGASPSGPGMKSKIQSWEGSTPRASETPRATDPATPSSGMKARIQKEIQNWELATPRASETLTPRSELRGLKAEPGTPRTNSAKDSQVMGA